MTSMDATTQDDVTYYTVSDDEFFLGTVMLVNSLRLTGNHGKVVVLDAGLTAEQSATLERHAEIVTLPRTERNAAIRQDRRYAGVAAVGAQAMVRRMGAHAPAPRSAAPRGVVPQRIRRGLDRTLAAAA